MNEVGLRDLDFYWRWVTDQSESPLGGAARSRLAVELSFGQSNLVQCSSHRTRHAQAQEPGQAGQVPQDEDQGELSLNSSRL